MNRRLISVLLFAFVVAGGASMILYELVVSRGNTASAAPATQILIATKDLEQGAVIGVGDVKIASWAGTPPPGAVTKTADAVGRGVSQPIYAGEAIAGNRLGAPGAGGGLAASIPEGMRAAAIRVNEVVGVAGFVVPGSHVDVLVSGNIPDSGGNITRTLLQDISVLSAGQDFKKDLEGKPVTVQVVNLLVTPEQAEMLSMATNQTTMQLVLRNPLDKAVTQTPGVNLLSVLSGSPARPVAVKAISHKAPSPAAQAPVVLPAVVAAAPPQPEPPRIEMIAGSKITEITVRKRDARE